MSLKFTVNDEKKIFIDFHQDIVIISKGHNELKVTFEEWQGIVYKLPEFKTQILEIVNDKKHTDCKLHVANLLYLSHNKAYNNYHVRRYYMNTERGEICPSRSGIAMSIQVFRKLVATINLIQKELPDCKKPKPCFISHNENEHKDCMHCNPWLESSVFLW